MRILIVEEALQTGQGHWPSYIGDLARALRSAGDEVTVLTHRAATPEVLDLVGGTPLYSRNCWIDPRSQGKIGGLLHNWHFHRETLSHLKSEKPYDRILALTMRMQHLLAFSALARSRVLPESTRFVLLFVQGFGHDAGPGNPTAFPKNTSTRIARLAFRRMAPAVRAGRVTLAAETKGMQDELQRFTDLPVSLFPHPVHLDGAAASQGTQRQVSHDKVLTICCPGFARHEKGSDLLHDAILKILESPLADRFRFILQWPLPFGMPDGSTMSPDPRLENDPRVELLNASLDAEAYAGLLARTDFVILPYRSQSYRQRLSRVAIEAAGAGIPLIYTAHTWTEEVATVAATGIRIEKETVDGIVSALTVAAECAEAMTTVARKNAATVRAFHSAGRFRQLLVDPATT